MPAINKELKRRKSLDYAAKQASKCRADRKIVSCFSCPDRETCDIQRRYKKALNS